MNEGLRIKKYRLEKGLTQQQLSEKCGINSANLRKYESGRQNPKKETLEKIAAALEIPVTKLLFDGVYILEEGYNIAEDVKIHPERYTPEIDRDGKIVAYSINTEKETMIRQYDLLNETGQLMVNNYVDIIYSSGKYTKPDEE